MTFCSILFKHQSDIANKVPLETAAPAFFEDLNLNQIIDAVTSGREEYNLKPFFYTHLHEIDAIVYRQEIMRDLENSALHQHISSFAQDMRAMRNRLPKENKFYYKYQNERYFLDSVKIYCDTVNALAECLLTVDIKSAGLLAFRYYMQTYTKSDNFVSLCKQTQTLLDKMSSLKYAVLINGLKVQVLHYNDESDYSVEVGQLFEKFKQKDAQDYKIKSRKDSEMNQVDAGILEGVAQLYPEIFHRLENYCVKNAYYLDETIASFDTQIQFYVAYLEYIAGLKQAGLNFCYPQISNTKDVYDYNGFDLALAIKLRKEDSSIVCNDFYLNNQERIFVVNGPNQGGKTTFARAFGQLHYLAGLGCPVPGRKAKLFHFDQLFTHFEREENTTMHRSKLEDDLVRIHHILDQATPRSIIIMNEILSSTTLQDAIFLSQNIMEKISQLDILCTWVTFIDELASVSEKNISMVSTVQPENPALRTFKIIRSPADGLAYALSIAEKHKVTYAQLKERIAS